MKTLTQKLNLIFAMFFIIGFMATFCMTAKAQSGSYQPFTFQGVRIHTPIPVSYYVPDGNGSFYQVKINEFKWNANHSLVCIPRDHKRKHYICIPPNMVEFQ